MTKNYLIAKQLIKQYNSTGRYNDSILKKLQDMFNELGIDDELETLELIVNFFKKLEESKMEIPEHISTDYLAIV